MSDVAPDDVPVENTPTASPSPPRHQELAPETTESHVSEEHASEAPAPIHEEASQEHASEPPAPTHEEEAFQEEPLHEPEAPATPIPPALALSPSALPTRTVAIIKPHALPHRFDIEHRISEAGFEIVKERQMEFDVETDPETLYELFGDDCECFAEGPVWVYVLERRRAVEMWATLMGHPDPAIARLETPTALRALYGASPRQNAVMGSPDVTSAEMQISSIFASSPPFPTTDLPDVGSGLTTTSSLRSASSSLLSALRKTGSSDSASGKTPFKARRLPSTHAAPDIVPRMSRAAALRVGIPVEKTGGPRGPLSKERLAQTFENVPGHKRTSTITVASTAPPAVAPRMTRAAALRLGLPPPEKESRRASMQVTTKTKSPDEASKATFDGVPGHKRRETITVASVKTPTVMPRTNRSAALRQQKETAPPTSYMFRPPTNQTPSRSASRTSFNGTSSARPTVSRPHSAVPVQPTPSRPLSSAASVQRTPSRPAASRVASTTSVKTITSQRSTSRPPTSTGIASTPSVSSNGDHKDASAKAKPRPRPSSMQAPTIAPRTNKSALLRAQKMAAAATPAGKKAVSATLRAVKV